MTTIERRDTPPRENLLRTAPFSLRAAADMQENDGLTFDGWGAVFNRETIIDSWEGKFREKLVPGSMKKTFRESPPKVQFDHGHHPLIGSIPIAALRSISEDTDPVYAPDGGAHVIARLMDNWLVQPVRDAIDNQSIDGMSFRFSVVREAWFDNEGKQIRDEAKLFDMLRQTWYEDVPDEELMLRELREVRVPEIGPVVWPAYEETSASVRSKKLTVDFGSLKTDPEQRKELARAVFLADAAERLGAERAAADASEEDDDPNRLALAVDSAIDEAIDLLADVDIESLPPEVQQAIGLIYAADSSADELLDALGVADPDEDSTDDSVDSTDTSPRSTDPETAAGTHEGVQDAPQTTESEAPAGEHPSRQKEAPKLGGSNNSWYLPGKYSKKGQL